MFRFENPDYLYALLLIPFIGAVYLFYTFLQKKNIARLGNPVLLKNLSADFSIIKSHLKLVLSLLALSVLIIAWANPQWSSKREKATRKAIDIFIALDISTSMLARDVAPNRLEKAKKIAQDIVTALKGNRVGLIVFAGNAYLQMPLTTDYAAAELFIRSAAPSSAPTQGTAIAGALDLAIRSFDQENLYNKAVIIISDGENHEPEALEKAKLAAEKGILISTIGVGTAEGAFIPIEAGGGEDYKRDAEGNPVRSKINETMLADLSAAAGGDYFNIQNSRERIIEAMLRKFEGLKKRELEQRSFTDFESYFQYFLFAALLLFSADWLVSLRKRFSLKN